MTPPPSTAHEPSTVFYFDLEAEVELLYAWIYATAKEARFPITIRVAGGDFRFDSVEGLVCFATGLKASVPPTARSEVPFGEEPREGSS